MWCWLSFCAPAAWTVFSLLMLCKLFCLCVGFARPSSSAVGTLTGRRSCINRLYCVQAAGSEKRGACFLRAGVAKQSIQPVVDAKKKELFVFEGGGESKHSPTECIEWAIFSETGFHKNSIMNFSFFFRTQFSKYFFVFSFFPQFFNISSKQFPILFDLF